MDLRKAKHIAPVAQDKQSPSELRCQYLSRALFAQDDHFIAMPLGEIRPYREGAILTTQD